MSANIAIVTTSGKAYYRLVSEFRRRKLPFLSLVPKEVMPLNVKVAITTEPEEEDVQCSNVLVYDESTEPSKVVDEAVKILRGKTSYGEMIIGVDPGKTLGLAVLGDGAILETAELPSVEKTVEAVMRIFEWNKADRKIVKVGNGVKECQSKLFKLLDRELSPKVIMESVEEEGTTKNIERLFGRRRNLIDALSAVKISMRSGRVIARKKYGKAG